MLFLQLVSGTKVVENFKNFSTIQIFSLYIYLLPTLSSQSEKFFIKRLEQILQGKELHTLSSIHTQQQTRKDSLVK